MTAQNWILHWNYRTLMGGLTACLVALAFTATATANPPGVPPGMHKVWQFNLIGHPGEYTGNCGNGRRIFVDRDANHAHILIRDDNDGWHIENCNATIKGDKAELHTDEVGLYAIYVRILGAPGGELDICADTAEDHSGVCSADSNNAGDICNFDSDCTGGGVCELGDAAHLCLLGIIDLTRGSGKSKFTVAPSEMFDAELEDIIWSVDTNNFKLAQFRVYKLDGGGNAKAINGGAGDVVLGDQATPTLNAPGSACGVVGMVALSLGLVGLTGLRLGRVRSRLSR